jgi:hypothetical protein
MLGMIEECKRRLDALERERARHAVIGPIATDPAPPHDGEVSVETDREWREMIELRLEDLQSLVTDLQMRVAQGESGAAPDGWVSVGERMPEAENHSVLVHESNDHNTFTAVWRGGLWFHFVDGNREVRGRVTHWMPLPAPPAPPAAEQCSAIGCDLPTVPGWPFCPQHLPDVGPARTDLYEHKSPPSAADHSGEPNKMVGKSSPAPVPVDAPADAPGGEAVQQVAGTSWLRFNDGHLAYNLDTFSAESAAGAAAFLRNLIGNRDRAAEERGRIQVDAPIKLDPAPDGSVRINWRSINWVQEVKLTQADAARKRAEEERDRIDKEIRANVNAIPGKYRVRVCEGGGPEGPTASLAISMYKLIQAAEARDAAIKRAETAEADRDTAQQNCMDYQAMIGVLEAKLKKATADLEAARKVLRDLESSGEVYSSNQDHPCCPVCRVLWYHGEAQGHTPGCALRAALESTPPVPGKGEGR